MKLSLPPFFNLPVPRVWIAVASSAALASNAFASPQEATQWLTTELRGMFHAAPIGLLETTPDASLTLQDLLVSGTSLTGSLPAEWTTARFGPAGADFPIYSRTALRAGIERAVQGFVADDLELGGVSSGGDVCPQIQADGRIVLGLDSNWYFLSVAIDNGSGTVYGTAGSTLASLASPQHSVISYYFEGNTIIQQGLRDAVAVEEVHSDLGFGVNDARRISGIDRGIGVISHDPTGGRTGWLASVRDKVYFSFTEAWLTSHGTLPALAMSQGGSLGANFEVTPGTIYEMTWDDLGGAIGWGWTDFRVAFTREDLFGTSQGYAELDALSVYERTGVKRVIFSTTLSTGSPDQLMGYDVATMSSQNSGGVPIRTQTGALVSGKLGLRNDSSPVGTDNVTGTCGGDPEHTILLYVAGIPVETDLTNAGQPLGLSVYRSRVEGARITRDAEALHLAVSGIPTNGTGPLAAFLDFGTVNQVNVNNGILQPTTWITLPPIAIPSGSSDFYLDIPGPLPALNEAALRIRVVDYNQNLVGTSYTSLLRL